MPASRDRPASVPAGRLATPYGADRCTSWRPAAQPPVRAVTSSTASRGSGSSYTSRNSRSTSQLRNRRSSALISHSSAASRSRDRSSPGGRRLAANTRTLGGASAISRSTAAAAGVPSRWCRSSRTTRARLPGHRSSSASRSSRSPVRSSRAPSAPTTDSWRCRTSRAASPSERSARNQAAGIPRSAAYCASTVVLPDPAGATTSPSRRDHPPSSWASSRGRTRPRGRGAATFALSTTPPATARCETTPLTGKPGPAAAAAGPSPQVRPASPPSPTDTPQPPVTAVTATSLTVRRRAPTVCRYYRDSRVGRDTRHRAADRGWLGLEG